MPSKKKTPTQRHAAQQKVPAQAPHPLSGYYIDKTGGRFWVASRPDFALYKLNEQWECIDPDSPLQDDPAHFERQLSFGTFTRINH